TLRGEAKRWLKAPKAQDPRAIARFLTAFPDHTGVAKLRQVQHALAREYGLASWAALKQEIEDRARSSEERIRLFLEKSVNRYGTDPSTRKWGSYEPDRPARGVLAARLLARHPEMARDSIHTAVAAHDPDAVRSFLQKNPALVHHRHPLDGWTPLLRLAYARLPIESTSTNALPIATFLLDAGADPNAGWSDGTNEFTALVGVIGGGEGSQSAHPVAEAFARLLIARGADPFAGQALYNTSLGPDSTFWLELLWSESAKCGETHKWTGPAPRELGGEKIPSALAYLLGNAVPNHIERTRWLLEHGADARGINFYSREPVIKHAVLGGREDVADLLVQYGATRPQLSEYERFSWPLCVATLQTCGNSPGGIRSSFSNPKRCLPSSACSAPISPPPFSTSACRSTWLMTRTSLPFTRRPMWERWKSHDCSSREARTSTPSNNTTAARP